MCLTVPAHRNFKVANHKPVPVTLYDYYNRHQSARLFYEPLRATTCDACDGDDCGAGCNSVPDAGLSGLVGVSGAWWSASPGVLLIVVCNLVTFIMIK